MNPKQEQAKKSYLNRMKTAVRGHMKDVFTGIIKNGVDNAETLHGVKVNTQQKLDDIVKAVFKKSQKDANKFKLLASDVKETIKGAYKQAVAAALHEAEEEKGSGDYSKIGDDFDLDNDDFMKEFDIDFDFDDDDDDNDDDESGNESYIGRLMNIKAPKLPEVSDESFEFAIESYDQTSLIASVILYINKCLLYYKAHSDEVCVSESQDGILEWLGYKICDEEGRDRLINTLQSQSHAVEIKPSTPDDIERVNDILNETIPPVYEKTVGLEEIENENPEYQPFDISKASDEKLQELVHLGQVVKDILNRLMIVDSEHENQAILVEIHDILLDLGRLYKIECNNTELEENIVAVALANSIGVHYPLLEVAIAIDLKLADLELIDATRQAVVLFSNILN